MLALGYGMPVMAPAYGCFIEYCDERSAILYDCIEAGLRRIAVLDQDGYSLLRKHAASQGESFSEDRIAKRYIDFFNSI